MIACPGCGAPVPDIDGPSHRYVGAAPGCWAAFNELLVRGASQYAVDAYCTQHPGVPGPQARRSVAKHLMNMCRYLERGGAVEDSTRFLRSLARDFPWLAPPPHLGDITVQHVLSGQASQDQWATAVWLAWSVAHPRIRAWMADGY
jgi:hypothetical protein